MLGSIIVLILLIIGLITTILFHKLTDLQCTKQLSMYYEFGRMSPVITGFKGRQRNDLTFVAPAFEVIE